MEILGGYEDVSFTLVEENWNYKLVYTGEDSHYIHTAEFSCDSQHDAMVTVAQLFYIFGATKQQATAMMAQIARMEVFRDTTQALDSAQ